MKVIIAEKPSVAKNIAAIVGAATRNDGYLEGNGYQVTWAYGHLLTLCEPTVPWSFDNLPIIPDRWEVQPVGKMEKGVRKPDVGALKQLGVIGKLFKAANEIIVATDAGREGELIFRYIYEYLSQRDRIKTPFSRLWISSLTEKAIRIGLSNLQPGCNYNNLSNAAKGRAQADWLVGMNATRALTLAIQAQKPGGGVFSVGRVQTPTLCMVCKRYLDNREFVSTPYSILTVTAKKQGVEFTAKNTYRFKTHMEAHELIQKINLHSELLVSNLVRKESSEAPPLLYDLTSLQKEANSKYGLSADATLIAAQSLYESGYITYPRTGSRYIPQDVYEGLPHLVDCITRYSPYSAYASSLQNTFFFKRSVDGGKVTDHHALLPTETLPDRYLSKNEQTVYDLIVSRLLESISQPCQKDVTNVTLVSSEVPGFPFFVRGCIITSPGWYAVRRMKEIPVPKDNEENDDTATLPVLYQNESLSLVRCALLDKKTKAPPLLTEATLLAMMESCGKEIEDENEREAIKSLGIGTPATRAAVIENLLSKDLMVRDKKSLLPTPKGLVLYEVVKEMSIANVSLTGQWENSLQQVESGQYDIALFNTQIIKFTNQIIKELSSVSVSVDKFPVKGATNCPCPKCGKQKISIFPNRVVCPDSDCGFFFYPVIAGRPLSPAEIITLCVKGKTKLLRGFINREGKTFDRVVELNKEFKPVFVTNKPETTDISCPRCGNMLSLSHTRVFCLDSGCGYFLFREVYGHKLTKDEIVHLFRYKRTDVISGLMGRSKKPFKAYLQLTDDFKIKLIFPD